MTQTKSILKSRASWAVSSMAIAFFGAALPAAAQENMMISEARYCGVGLQGAKDSFQKANPALFSVFNDRAKMTQLSEAILRSTDSSKWKIRLTQDGGASLALAHLFTYGSIDEHIYTDPRDRRTYRAAIFSIGINTVVIDTVNETVRAVVPAIISYSERFNGPLTPAQQSAGFIKLLSDTDDRDSASYKWISNLSEFDFQLDETNLAARPLILSDDALRALQSNAGNDPRKSVGLFIQRLTAQQEALMASAFRKSVIPSSIDENGKDSSQSSSEDGKKIYAAMIPDCFDGGKRLELPKPNFELQISIDTLMLKDFEHRLAQSSGAQAGQVFQVEQGYGGRFNVKIIGPGETVDTPLDEQTFGFSRSVRLDKARDISAYEQYSKLTANFIAEALEAYATQEKGWVKQHLSSTITDKKRRDAKKIAKSWKSIIVDRMKVAPLPRKKDEDD